MFTLKIPVTPAAVDAVKAELARTLPEVKSSHRCEAVARGLEFRTYASLRATAESTPVVTARGAAFNAYLSEHGFKERALPFYRAVARVAMRNVLEKTPRLTRWGIGVGQPRRKPDGRWESWGDLEKKFDTEREALLKDDAIESFLLSLAFLSRVQPTKTIRPDTSSYRLKHIAEKYACTYPEGDRLGPQYVANGDLIAAAILAGFKFKTYFDNLGYLSLNVNFNMSQVSLENLDCEIRPNGARAQARRARTLNYLCSLGVPLDQEPRAAE